MIRPAELPPEFGEIRYKLHYVQRATNNEYSSECPTCGGVPHQSGDLPDRCRWFDDGRPRGWCRQCGAIFWPDMENGYKPDPAELKRWQDEREEAEKRTKAKAEHALDLIRQERVWLRYYEQQTDESRQRWVSWGIPSYWQDYYKLGYDPAHVVYSGGDEWQTPTMTIPIFEPITYNVLNVRHRLLNPQKPGDKYRPERAGLPQSLFVACPDMKIGMDTLIVEGEKKAMVTWITSDNPLIQVVGLPGCSPKQDLLKQFEESDPIYICLDPDAQDKADDIGRSLGKDRCRIIDLPGKIDDLIIDYGLDKNAINGLINTARRVR